jgi:enterochelin esterase-like enzyme
MKYFNLVLILLITGTGIIRAQNTAEGIPAPTNVSKTGYPRILPDNRVIFQATAPQAVSVQIDLQKRYNMSKTESGAWRVITDPIEPGFHYYSLIIDGGIVADPASESYYGMGRMASGIDIPEDGIDFYNANDAPHGDIRNRIYYSKTTQTWRRINIYTPAGYDTSGNEQYPVLYILHGGGEDERGWAEQGKTDLILDNLIAEGKAIPMIVVIPNGNVLKPGVRAGGYNDEAMAIFKEELFENVIPFIESNYRVKPGAENRAISGLSMGGGQAFYTGLRNTDMFAGVGVFSTGLFGGIGRQPGSSEFDPESVIPGILTNPQSFNSRLKVFYISVGEQDPRIEATRKLVETFRSKRLNVEFASFPGAHEWQVWRKSLHDFAQKLFK